MFQYITKEIDAQMVDDAITLYWTTPDQEKEWNPPSRYQLREWYKLTTTTQTEQVQTPFELPTSQGEDTDETPPQPKEWHWKELPIIGTVVKWVGNWGSERLVVKAVEPDGRCQLEGFGGTFWNSYIRRVMPVSG